MKRHLIFDFFGTLVNYETDRSQRDFSATLNFLAKNGIITSKESFLEDWNQCFSYFNELTAESLDEYSMHQIARRFTQEFYGLTLDPDRQERLVDTYLGEWEAGVTSISGVSEMLSRLRSEYTLSVLSNTHSENMVPRLLKQMGLESYFDTVLTSATIGKKKPHPEVYSTIISSLSASPDDATYIGDSLREDFLGPKQAGLQAFLIDASEEYDITTSYRLKSILDLEQRLQCKP